ncbi:hypothetical protein SFC65_20390 [Priestia filamentosa]|uniref:hypothetical protein n=1 Tax=Priestia filamentosa TaxID=1402861 RepID=UPI003982ABC3
MNKLFIKGEIVNDLPNELPCSDIHFVGYEIRYIARKTKAVEGEESVKISLLRSREDQLKGKQNGGDSSLQKKVMIAHKNALHKKFEGQCQECGQRCDKIMIKVPDSNPNPILCINCFNGWKEPVVKFG